MEWTGRVEGGVVVLEPGPHLDEGTPVRELPLDVREEATTLGQRLLRFSGSVRGLPCDTAENHSHYIQGALRQ